MSAPAPGDLGIIPTTATPVGVVVSTGEGWLYMHPLDVCALSYPVATERLPHAMAWLLGVAHGRLDALIVRGAK